VFHIGKDHLEKLNT